MDKIEMTNVVKTIDGDDCTYTFDAKKGGVTKEVVLTMQNGFASKMMMYIKAYSAFMEEGFELPK